MNEYFKRKKYPSQIKYEKNNPTITLRMKKYEKEKIQDMAKKTGKSISMLIRMALLNLEKDFSAAITKAKDDGKEEGIKIGNQNSQNEGYTKGKNDWAIWCYCWKCIKPLYIIPNSNDHQRIIDEMKGRLSHTQCP